ncbi:MAG: hypothetical protein Q9161_003369 [Pseudevernia consocians]
MAPGPVRPRSNTSGSTASSRPRPISRASTTSINTTSAHPAQQIQPLTESSQTPQARPGHGMPSQYHTEDIITRSEQQLTNQNLNRQYAVDPSLQDPVARAQAMGVEDSYNGNNEAMRQLMNHNHSFDGQGQQFVMTFNDEQTQDDAGAGETKKKKGSASSIANDNELRKLFAANKDRDLNDVAASVLANERGPKSEKTKQIFAMNW